MAVLFAEELGLVIEVDEKDLETATHAFTAARVPCAVIGKTTAEPRVRISVNGEVAVEDDMRRLRDIWEATSFQLERRQADPAHVDQEEAGLFHRQSPPYALSFQPIADCSRYSSTCNGDRRWRSFARRDPTPTARWLPPSTWPASKRGT